MSAQDISGPRPPQYLKPRLRSWNDACGGRTEGSGVLDGWPL